MNAVNKKFLLFLGLSLLGVVLILVSFALLGFPEPRQEEGLLLWWKITFLLVVLAVPFALGGAAKERPSLKK